MEGPAAVQARIGQLQARMQQLQTLACPGPVGGAVPMGAAWSSSTTGSSFAASIAGLLTSGDPGSGPTAPSLGVAAVALARTYNGVPYTWGGTDPKSGLDCSGLVQLVYRQLGVDLPRTSQQQQHSGTEIPLSQAQAGDLVFFGEPAHHVGIYVGDGMMIDAPHTGSTVGVHKIAGYGKVSHVRRLTSPGADLAASAVSRLSGQSTSALPGPYAELFTSAGARYGVDPALLSAVAKAESGYRPKAVSGAGAQGLMQLMPGTARSLSVDPLQPDQAVDGAARLLSGYLKAYSGRVDLALAAYNAGPGAVDRYGGVPPYAETRTYVQRVTSYWKALR